MLYTIHALKYPFPETNVYNNILPNIWNGEIWPHLTFCWPFTLSPQSNGDNRYISVPVVTYQRGNIPISGLVSRWDGKNARFLYFFLPVKAVRGHSSPAYHRWYATYKIYLIIFKKLFKQIKTDFVVYAIISFCIIGDLRINNALLHSFAKKFTLRALLFQVFIERISKTTNALYKA